MKKECVVCKKAKGKRACRLHKNEVVCSRCCAAIRGHDCEECSYFEFAEKYHSSKFKKSLDKKFVIEINEEVEEVVDRALGFIERDSLGRAETIIMDLIISHPENHMVQYAIGVLNAAKGQYDEAITHFNKATDIFPYFVEAHFNTAVAYQKKMDVGNAIKAFQKVVGLGDPEDEHVQHSERFLFELEKVVQKTEGINLKTYVRAQDEFDEANHYMNHQQWEKAIVKFKECLALNKTHPQSYGNMGICYSKLGQKEKAIAALDKALEIDPTYELAMVNRAVIESLKDGEKMERDSVESIEYVKEYPMKKKSYIQSLIQK